MDIFIFDNCSLSLIINTHYIDVQERFWELFSNSIENGNIASVKEVRHEMKDRFSDEKEYLELLKHSDKLFPKLTHAEMFSLKRLMENKRVHDLISRKKRLAGKPLADPMLIAKAMQYENAVIVTEEEYKPNGIKIPNVCEMYNIKCINFRSFLIENKWRF